MNGHVTIAFSVTVEPGTYPCGAGDHDHVIAGGAEAVAYCICGWWFLAGFEPGNANDEDTARTLATMKATEHATTSTAWIEWEDEA